MWGRNIHIHTIVCICFVLTIPHQTRGTNALPTETCSGFGKNKAWLLLPAQPGVLRLRMSLTSSSLLFLIILPAFPLHPPGCLKSNGDPRSVPAVLPSILGLPDSPQPLPLAAQRWHRLWQEGESSPPITWLQEGHLRYPGTLGA